MNVPDLGIFLDLATEHERLDEHLARYLPLLELAREAGFRSVWAGESYPRAAGGFQHAPSPMLMLAALGPRLDLDVGTAVTLLPVWDPLRLAYDTIMLDQLTGGRFTLGVGLGNPGTWRLFGIDPATVGERMDEMIQALRALWSGADGFHGEVVDVSGPIGPRPTREAGPPIWVGGKIGRSVRRAAKWGDGYIAGTHFRLEHVARQVAGYRAALVEAGKPEDGPVSINRVVVLADDPEEAWRDGAPYVGRLLRKYIALKMIPGAEALVEAAPDDLAALRAAAAGICLIGSPESIAPELNAYLALGVSEIQVRPAPSGLPDQLAARTVRLFGERVLPGLRAAAAAR